MQPIQLANLERTYILRKFFEKMREISQTYKARNFEWEYFKEYIATIHTLHNFTYDDLLNTRTYSDFTSELNKVLIHINEQCNANVANHDAINILCSTIQKNLKINYILRIGNLFPIYFVRHIQ